MSEHKKTRTVIDERLNISNSHVKRLQGFKGSEFFCEIRMPNASYIGKHRKAV